MNFFRTYRSILWILGGYLILVFLIYLAESGHEDSNIKTFFDTIWYSLVTLTTVGYGDFFPKTVLGKLLGFLFLIGSLGILGILIGRITEKINELRERRKMGYNGTNFTHHIIIIGWDEFARTVTTQLIYAERKVAIVTDKKDDIDLIYEAYGKEQVFVLFSDLKNNAMLEKLNVAEAYMLFLNLKDDTDKLISILNIKKSYPDASFMVTLENSDLQATFQSAGVTYALSKNEIAAKMLASYIFEPDVANYESDLLASVAGEDDYDIQQYKVLANNPYANRSYGETFTELKQRYNVVCIGLVKLKEESRTLIKIPADNAVIEVGDYLIMIVSGQNEQFIVDTFKTREGVG